MVDDTRESYPLAGIHELLRHALSRPFIPDAIPRRKIHDRKFHDQCTDNVEDIL
jgi:hypothetical protein